METVFLVFSDYKIYYLRTSEKLRSLPDIFLGTGERYSYLESLKRLAKKKIMNTYEEGSCFQHTGRINIGMGCSREANIPPI